MNTKLWMAGICVGLMGAAPAAQAQISGAGGTNVGAQVGGSGLGVGTSLGTGVNANTSGMNVGAGLNATTPPATTTPGSNVNIRGDARAINGADRLRGNATGGVNTSTDTMRGYGAGVMGNSRIDGSAAGTGSVYGDVGVGADVRSGTNTGVSGGAGAATQGRVNR